MLGSGSKGLEKDPYSLDGIEPIRTVDQGPQTSASGRLLPVVTVRDFSGLATCYAGLNGRDRPEADAQT